MKYAAFDPTADQPTPVTGWYDADAIDYPSLPDAAERIEIAEADWPHRFDTPYVQDGQLVAEPEPTVAEQLAAAKAAKRSELQAGFAATIAAGGVSDALGTPHLYPADAESRADMSASVVDSLLHAGEANWTTEFACAPVDNADLADLSLVEHTGTQIQQAGSDIRAWYTAQKRQLKTLSQQVGAVSEDDDAPLDTVAAIEWTETNL
ncbi:hypothetical protein [Salinisphaera orenii]|uniref:hypothetical protein n=1 Tax=Salinisphaera orenii TaxID=856731 RepID=UPI000DBE87E0